MSNVGYATVSIIPSAKGFGSALNKEIGPSLGASGKTAGGTAGKGFKGAFMAPLAALGPAVAGVMGLAAVGGFLKGAVAQASDLNEVGTALKVVFGDGLKEVEAFGNTGAKALGMSKLEALQAAQSFGVYGKAAGLSGKENAKFSTSLASLGTDMASFYNASPEETIAAIGSGLRGEAEPLRKFGVLLDDATLKTQAMKMGLIKTTKDALSPGNKVLAARASIMEQSKIAQGDFAKTSGGLANQQRILSAQWTDAKGKIGGIFLPMVLGAVKGLNGLFDAITPIKDAFAGVFSILGSGDFKGADMTFGLSEDSPVVDILFKIRDAFTKIAPAAKAFGAQILPALKSVATAVGTALLPSLMRLGGIFVNTIIPAVVAVAGYFIANLLPIFKSVYTIIATNLLPIVTSFANFFTGKLLPAIIGIWTAVATSLKPVLDALFNVIKVNVIPAVAQIVAKFREWQPTIMKVISAVVGVVGWVLKLAAAILGKVLTPIIKFVGWLIGKLVGAILAVIGVVIKIIGKIVDFGSALVGGVKKAGEFVTGLKAKFGEAVTFVRGIPGKAKSALGSLGTTLLGAGKSLIDGFIQGIKNGFDAVKRKLGELTDLLPDWKGPVALDKVILRKNGRHVINGFVDGLEDQYPSVKGSLGALTKSLAIDAPNGAYGSATGSAGSGSGSPLVGSLSIESTGNAKNDLEEALFQLRRINRGG